MASGRYFAATGRDLRDENARLLYDYAYFLLTEMSLRTQEEADALGKLDNTLSGLDFEDETGMPAIARQFRPADEFDRPVVGG